MVRSILRGVDQRGGAKVAHPLVAAVLVVAEARKCIVLVFSPFLWPLGVARAQDAKAQIFKA